VIPFLAVLVILVFAAAIRSTPARWLIALSVSYLAVFSFLPQDSRYLVPLLPLLSIAAAMYAVTRWPHAAMILSAAVIAPSIAYSAYRLALNGLPPSTSQERHQWLTPRVPEYRALLHAGNERIYACRAEHLKSYAAGDLLGDFSGPYSFDRILNGATTTQAIAEKLRQIDVRYFLLAKRTCPPPQPNGGMNLIYEDKHAQLWRVLAR